MAFKIGKILKVNRVVKANVPGDGEEMRVEKMNAGFCIFPNSEQKRIREAIAAEKVVDVDLEFLKRHAITSIEGPEFEDGTALTIDEALDMPYLRAAIETDYSLVSAGIKRKN